MEPFRIEDYKYDDKVSYYDQSTNCLFYVRSSLVNDEVTVCRIEIPETLKNESLFIAFVYFSKTERFTSLATGTQHAYASTLKMLVSYFVNNVSLLKEKNDRALSVHFLAYLRDDKYCSSDTVIRRFNILKQVLTFAADKFSPFYESEHYDVYLKELLIQLPIIQKNDSVPKRVFSDVFATDYTDEQILISMRRVLVWFLKEMTEIRQGFLAENKELGEEIFNTYDDGKLTYKNAVMRMALKDVGCFVKAKTNGQYLSAMLRLKKNVVNECMLMSLRHIGRDVANGARFTTWQIRRELQNNLNDKNSLKRVANRDKLKESVKNRYASHIYQGSIFNGISQSVLPIGIMYTSTLAERRAMAWLVASDRIQSSGFDDVKLEDVLLDDFDEDGIPHKLQFRYPKQRAKRSFEGAIYHRGKDELFDIFYNFYLLRVSEGEHFPNVERPGFLMPSKWNKLFQRPSAICQSTHLPLLLLGLEGTEMYNACLRDVDMAEPFLQVLVQSVKSSTRYRNSCSMQRYFGAELDRCNMPISMDMISQTRATMEDGDDDDAAVTAESSAHSQKTHDLIYLDRSDVSKKQESRIHRFGSDVGDKIYDLAKQMRKLVNEEPDYNGARMIEKLGLSPASVRNLEGSTELNQVIERSKGSGLGLLSGSSQSSEKYVFQDSTIAAIIMSYVSYLDRAKEFLDVKSVEHEVATTHQIYLESLLERFHRKHIKEGREIASKYNLPYRGKL